MQKQLMPHVSFVAFTGLRVREAELLELGMQLPGLKQRGATIARLPPLGVLTLAGMMPESWTCSLHDCVDEEGALLECVLADRPTLVAISALTASIVDAYRFSDRLRQVGIPVVMGGLHVTACPEEAQQHCDAVVVGDGEPVWQQVLRDAECARLQPVYRSPGNFDLADSPVPRFDLLGPERRPRWTLQTQRGCPLACDFCGASRLLGRFREKPIEKIAAELRAMRQIDPKLTIELADDNTFAREHDTEAMLELLADHNVRYFTETDWRIGERPEQLARLASSGCVQLLVGVESLVFRHTGMGGKQADLQRIMDSVVAIQEAGIVVNGCFIVGCDGETSASLDRLTEFLLHSPFGELQLTLQTPFPGTALRNRLQKAGRLLPERGWPFYTLFDVTYQPDEMTVAELETGFRRLLQTVFAAEVTRQRDQHRRQIWRKHPRMHS